MWESKKSQEFNFRSTKRFEENPVNHKRSDGNYLIFWKQLDTKELSEWNKSHKTLVRRKRRWRLRGRDARKTEITKKMAGWLMIHSFRFELALIASRCFGRAKKTSVKQGSTNRCAKVGSSSPQKVKTTFQFPGQSWEDKNCLVKSRDC